MTSSVVGIFYFEKNEPTLWCFSKNKDVLVKSVYFAIMYRCDKDMTARLNIAYVVLKEYKNVESVYQCWLLFESLIPEAMVKFSKENVS